MKLNGYTLNFGLFHFCSMFSKFFGCSFVVLFNRLNFLQRYRKRVVLMYEAKHELQSLLLPLDVFQCLHGRDGHIGDQDVP